MNLKTVFLMFICFGFFSPAFTQEKTKKKDSTNVYQKIETYSKKRKSTKLLHKLIFRSTQKKNNSPGTQTKREDFSIHNGKIIRTIRIQSHDPFGFSFTDSTETANSWLEKTGNKIHIKTKRFTIRNFLLIKKNRPFDILLLHESERLLRSQNFVRSVEVDVETVGQSNDSVDVFIDVLDSWSLTPKVDLSTTRNTVRLKDRNFLGFGHQIEAGITDRFDDQRNGYSFRYAVPNFKNTFISTTIGYNKNLEGFYGTYVDVSRPFYSPLARWAGGIYIGEQFRREDINDAPLILDEQNFKYQSQDIWGGHAFKIYEGTTEKERTTNLISSARLLNVNYQESPSIAYDSIRYFSSEIFYLGSVGIASRQFIQDSYIFRDGITEDVPIGTIFAITGGVQYQNKLRRPYVGVKASHGNYFSWGYLSTNFEYGTYFNDSKAEQSAYSLQANYFTNLISLGKKWKLRQFVKPQILIGTNRLNSIGDRLTLNDNNRFPGPYGNEEQRKNSAGIPGFNSPLLGTKKFVLSLQTQLYSPRDILGFRLNPFVNITSGILANEGESISKSKVYSAFGVGFIVRNDYLVFSSFQVSFSYYPSIPGQGNDIIDTNSFSTEDFGFQNFELGKPTPIWYN